MKTIAIIIPTVYSSHGTRLQKTIHAAKYAQAHGRMTVHILCVFNAVPHGINERDINESLGKLQRSVKVLVNYKNKGFTGAVNDGIIYARAMAKPDWYLVLNDDAYLHQDFFQKLLPTLESVKYDAVSCKILTPRGDVESVGLRYFPTGLAFPRRKDVAQDEQSLFTGTCVLLSKSRVDKELSRHGYVFNPLFFAYAEDVELSLRILRDGGKIFMYNDSLVTHEGSLTAVRGSFFQLYYGYRNLLLVMLLLWPWKDFVIRLPFIFVGQLYIIVMSFYKGYFLLYPKIWLWIWRNRAAIQWQRKQYAKK